MGEPLAQAGEGLHLGTDDGPDLWVRQPAVAKQDERREDALKGRSGLSGYASFLPEKRGRPGTTAEPPAGLRPSGKVEDGVERQLRPPPRRPPGDVRQRPPGQNTPATSRRTAQSRSPRRGRSASPAPGWSLPPWLSLWPRVQGSYLDSEGPRPRCPHPRAGDRWSTSRHCRWPCSKSSPTRAEKRAPAPLPPPHPLSPQRRPAPQAPLPGRDRPLAASRPRKRAGPLVTSTAVRLSWRPGVPISQVAAGAG